MTGKIKTLIVGKGFRFVRTAAGDDYFFHKSVCVDDWDALRVDQAVTFEVVDSERGPRCTVVEKA